MQSLVCRGFLLLCCTAFIANARPQAKGHERKSAQERGASHQKKHPSPLVAYDERDHRYYLLAWAKKHGMRDPGGDPLRIVPWSQLPKGAHPAIVPPQRLSTRSLR